MLKKAVVTIISKFDKFSSPRRNMAYVVGVGMTKFEKPMTRKWDYPDMGREAG